MLNDHEHKMQVLAALRKAVDAALDRKRRLGQYAVIWRNGRPVRCEPEALGSAGEYALGDSASPSTVREPGAGDDGDDEGPK